MRTIKLSQKGKREVNQDLILDYTSSDGSFLLAIIDGMGGYENGEIAAEIISENIKAYLSTVGTINAYHLQKAINKSSLAIRQKQPDSSEKMGATIGGIVLKDTSIIYFWVGDVKVFHFRNKKLLFESSPHTLISDLVESGAITEPSKLSKYKHVVTRSIHGDIDKSKAEIYNDVFDESTDILIICSDGVHDHLDGIQIENLFLESSSINELNSTLSSCLLEVAEDNYSYGIVYD